MADTTTSAAAALAADDATATTAAPAAESRRLEEVHGLSMLELFETASLPHRVLGAVGRLPDAIKLLVCGPPSAGKDTLANHLASMLREAEQPVSLFTPAARAGAATAATTAPTSTGGAQIQHGVKVITQDRRRSCFGRHVEFLKGFSIQNCSDRLLQPTTI